VSILRSIPTVSISNYVVLPLLVLLSSACFRNHQRGDHDKLKSAAVQEQAIQAVHAGLRSSSVAHRLRALAITRKRELHGLRESVRALLASSNAMVAGAAALHLQNSDPRASEIAIAKLSSPDEHVRAFMLRGLVRNLGNKAQQHILLGLQDQSSRVRKVAVSALLLGPKSEALALLLQIAHSDTGPQVRARALIGLLKVGAEEGKRMQETIARALGDRYIGARIAGVALLQKFGHNNSTQTLTSLSQSDDVPLALRAAVVLRKQSGADMKWVVLAAMQSAEPEARAAALNTAAECTDKEGALEIARQGATDKIAELRLTAARLFLRLGQKEEAMQLFRDHLISDKLSDVLMAATELANEGDEEALHLLSRMSESGSTADRIATLDAQRSAGILSEGVLACLQDPELALRLAAADALLAK